MISDEDMLISQVKQSFHTVAGQSGGYLDFLFWFSSPFYFLKWNRYFSTFVAVLTSLIYLLITVEGMY